MTGQHSIKKGIGIIFDKIFLVNGMRTPFGKYCGTLSQVSPTDLGICSARAALEKAKVSPDAVDQVIAANIGQSSGDAYFLPRHISLFAGIPEEVPSLMVQRICGSGFETIVAAAEQITLGKAGTVLCVGTETMSLAPTASFGNRSGYPLGRPGFIDMLWEALDDTAAGYSMALTGENVAKKLSITRQECDDYAFSSFQRALDAKQRDFFAGEVTPVNTVTFTAGELKPRKLRLPRGVENFTSDEHVRATTRESLAKLASTFSADGVLTAGNCSGIVDGAASVVIASQQSIDDKGLKPIARVVAATSVGIDPRYMGLAPVPAIQHLLEISGLQVSDIGLFEINEAFSAQVIGCERELGLDRARLNVNGGAIALGHPLAATGVRLSLTISREMQARNVRFGIVSACIGGGQATAVLLENTACN
ncbi:MAG: thiolase family protein [Chlorobi bacterium]|nr:MAG: thiolase family protein [Bacteroidota bacterium]KXK35967.1 MAG: acetyl-CoA acetyltransferase [Chlorobi bacterium OLB6]MBL1161421.1 thiolase family protein [Chlorobiota bacterium]MBW7854022.1 thiolase family protein [Candidatus Kapabacteria bacterium]MCC6331907.1 thiolase family protein [Ignavibacteria bacterium]